ncbi:MAG: winged helix-turn-helix transcriptional regulator [Clostridia bacterium]|nr:winged helix-turn-helix transcriptional regulator [Clostridia bacterium]
MKNHEKFPPPPPERKELSNTPVKMCNEISHLFHSTVRELNESDYAAAQRGTRMVISFLAIGDGVTQLDLVNATHLKAPTVSVILKKLEDDGIVERQRDKTDLRILRVYLTDKGRELDRKNIEKIKQADAIALEGLSGEECAEMMRLLGKIRDNLLQAKSSREDKKQ